MKRQREGSFEICPLTSTTSSDFSSLLSALLPVRFPPSFFRQLLADPDLVQLAYEDTRLVGAVAMTMSSTDAIPEFCIAALCVRPTYRNQGIGLALMKRAIEVATNKFVLSSAQVHPETVPQTINNESCTSLPQSLLTSSPENANAEDSKPFLTLHVQCKNSEAISIYRRVGFVISETIQNYYPRLADPHCYVMTKALPAR